MNIRDRLKDKKRIVIKVGTSTITYEDSGKANLGKLERFVRILINLRSQGKEVIVVSSGAIGVGRNALKIGFRPQGSLMQACAAVGQARLMMIYEKLFSEYSQLTAQVLLTKESIYSVNCRQHARDTFEELLKMDVLPIVNANDSISVDEGGYGNFSDNDTMSADVAALVEADLLILLSDIEGLYTDDPRTDENARFVHTVYHIDEVEAMGKGAGTNLGTGGMATKIEAAKVATRAGADMVIANGDNVYLINDILAGKKVGTLFVADPSLGDQENEIAPARNLYHRREKNERKSNRNKQ